MRFWLSSPNFWAFPCSFFVVAVCPTLLSELCIHLSFQTILLLRVHLPLTLRLLKFNILLSILRLSFGTLHCYSSVIHSGSLQPEFSSCDFNDDYIIPRIAAFSECWSNEVRSIWRTCQQFVALNMKISEVFAFGVEFLGTDCQVE